jgi:hypothetical protein
MREPYERFKTLTYPRDGDYRVRFRIPDDWAEDYGDEQAGLFFPVPDQGEGPWPIGGMLLTAVSHKISPEGWSQQAIEQFVRSRIEPEEELRLLANGGFLVRSRLHHDEESHRAVDHRWRLLRSVGSSVLVQALFVFSAVECYYDKPGDIYYYAVEMLDREIAAAEFEAAEPGATADRPRD